MPPIVNIAAYHFATLTGLTELRADLYGLCRARKLRGTILLSPEGINLFVAGERDDIDALVDFVRAVPGLADIEVKESFSDDRPFNRMLVKIKREIIAFGVDGIDPRQYTSRRLKARDLKKWLDEGRPVTLLDTRNDFEFEAGTFTGAIPARLDDFRQFPEAVKHLPEELKHHPIVTFCTGGIRCEKAAPYLEKAGFTDIYQLHGGILKYFEECGSAHYTGDCFVFDKRVALNAELKASGLGQCFACQAILSADELKSDRYVEGVSCPRCYQSTDEITRQTIAQRHEAIRRATQVLPGSVPYDNVRPISVPLRYDGMELLDFLDAMRTYLSRDEWVRAANEGRLLCRDEPVTPGRIMRAGERLFHTEPATREPDVNADIIVLHEDDALVVIHKPAPLPMHPCGRFNRNTLSYILDEVYHPIRLRPAHRLDADTSGVVVLAKSREVARLLQREFEQSRVAKRYLARVHGHPADDRFECHAAIADEPGDNGLRLPNADGASASTRFRVLKRFEDGTALVDVEPLTGRTNQIRVHAWHMGYPIVGDPIYLPDGKTGVAVALPVGVPPLCLQSASIELVHPVTRQRVRFDAPQPAWADGEIVRPVAF